MLERLELLPIISAFFLALILLVVMTPVAHQLGLVDVPNRRKQHEGIIPLTGGLAIYLSVFLSSYLTDKWLDNSRLFFTASAFIVILGVLDDKFNLSPRGRLICQFLVAVIMALIAQNHIYDLGNLFGFGSVNLTWLGHLFTLVCVVGVINAFNMIDGIDGLAGGMSLVTLVMVLLLSLVNQNHYAIMTPIIMIAAIIPFLAFNLSWKGFKGNKIFMGDSGSMFLGLTIVWLLVDFTQTQNPVLRPITAVWLIGLPLMDMAAVMYRRARKGQSMLRADRFHLHNIFMKAGLSSRSALIAILLLACSISSIGIVGELLNVSESLMFFLFILCLSLYMYTMQKIWKILRLVKNIRWLVLKF